MDPMHWNYKVQVTVSDRSQPWYFFAWSRLQWDYDDGESLSEVWLVTERVVMVEALTLDSVNTNLVKLLYCKFSLSFSCAIQ